MRKIRYIGNRKYRIIKYLGQGNYGKAYLVMHVKSGDKYVVKMLKHEKSDNKLEDKSDKIRHKNFGKEIKSMLDLKHPNIVKILNYDITLKNPYYVMEYCQGGSIIEKIKKDGMDIREINKIFHQLCDALKYSHFKGIIHRDIKPQNILFDQNNDVKIADFGMCKNEKQDKNKIILQSDPGTIGYISPEQNRDPEKVDNRTDLYSLGITLRHMLTGKVFGEGKLSKYVKNPKRKKIVREFNNIVEKMTKISRSQRINNIDKVIKEFKKINIIKRIGNNIKKPKIVRRIKNRDIINANNYFKIVLRKCNMDKFEFTKSKDLMKISLNLSWYNFLNKSKDFDCKMKMVAKSGDRISYILSKNTNKAIIFYSSNKSSYPIFFKLKDVEKSYKSLKKIDSRNRNLIYKNFCDS